eukprot:g17322.t1
MVYTITLTNPLASGHDGSWKLDLLMECVVDAPADTSVTALGNGDPPPQMVGRDNGGSDGGIGGAHIGANGSGGGASADARSSPQQPLASDIEEVEDISSDEDDDEGVDGGGGNGDGDVAGVQDTPPQEADLTDASDISEDDEDDDDEDADDDDNVDLEDEDNLIRTVHENGGAGPRKTATGEEAGGVGDGVRTDRTSSGAMEGDQQQEDLDLPSGRADVGGIEHEPEDSQHAATPASPVAPAAPDSTALSKSLQKQHQQQMSLTASGVEACLNEDEIIATALTERRKQPEFPTVTKVPAPDRPGDKAGRQSRRSPAAPSPPPSPSSSSRSMSSSPESAKSQTAESVEGDSDSAFDASDESSWGSEGETDDDSDGYEVDVLPPTNCFSLHRARKTYKKALCYECYTEYEETLKERNLSMSDIDSDTGRRKKPAASRRRKKESGGSGADCGKRSRKSRQSSSEGSLRGDGRKRRKLMAASVATADSAPAAGRRLVKPHRKKAKKLAVGEDEAVSNARLLEDTTSSSSEGGDGGEGALRRGKGKNKRVADKPHTIRPQQWRPRKKQGSESDGSGAGVDLLSALIANPAPARKMTNIPSPATQAAPAPQAQEKRPKITRQRSADAVERPGSGGGGFASDGREPPQLARGGSLDTTISALSLSQYRGGVLGREVPGVLPNSSLRQPGSKVAKAAPIDGGCKKIRAEHARRGSKTPALKSSTNTSANRGISNRAPTTTLPVPSNSIKGKYEKVTHYRGVWKKKSNGKFFVWVDDAPLDGKPYETAEQCAKAYDQLFLPSARGSACRPQLNFGDARAPSHAESDGLTPLTASQGSRLSKGAVTSGYKPKRGPFFAPTETLPQPRHAQAPTRQRSTEASRGQQPSGVAARAAQWRPPQVVAPRQQHGAAAVMALIDPPSTSSKTNRRQVAPPPPVDAFNTARSSKVKWSSPIKNDEDLNGRRVLPKASVLPKRSGLAGGRAGRPVPDTREFCKQAGVSGTFRMRDDDDEEEGEGDGGGVGAETTLTPEEVFAPARGSLLEHVPDEDGPTHENLDSESKGSPRRTEEGAAAMAASTMSSAAATSPPPPPSRAEPTVREATESVEENGDEEQGRELIMSFIGGNLEEKREPMTNSAEGDTAAEDDCEELRGEEEQGRELVMRMAAGGDTPLQAVPPVEEEEDETVPPTPPSGAESDADDSSDPCSDEDDDDAAMSLEDEPHPVVEWKRPAPVGGGSGNGGGGSGGGSRTNASSPGHSNTANSTATAVVNKPTATTRSFTRFSAAVAAAPAPPVPGASATGHVSLSYERSPQLPISNNVHQSMRGANAMPAPPNPPPLSGGPPQRVVWRTPRRTAVPAAVTPITSVERQQEEQGEEHHCEDSSVELELPSEVVDALNPPAVTAVAAAVRAEAIVTLRTAAATAPAAARARALAGVWLAIATAAIALTSLGVTPGMAEVRTATATTEVPAEETIGMEGGVAVVISTATAGESQTMRTAGEAFLTGDPSTTATNRVAAPTIGTGRSLHNAEEGWGNFGSLSRCAWPIRYPLEMSLDQISSRGSRISRVGGSSSGAWEDGYRGGGMRSEVSRPQSSVVVDGGGTFRSAIASTTRAPVSGGSGPMRRQGVARVARESAAPYSRPTRGADSVYNRLGGRVQDEAPGTHVLVEGLNHDVMDDDIKELFAGVGELKHCAIDYDRAGRSNGRATVVFKREEDAESAVSQFHKRTLDGAPMHVEIVDPPPAPEPRGGGVRGRGGTALREPPAATGGGGFQNGSSRPAGGGGYSGNGVRRAPQPQSRVTVSGPVMSRLHQAPVAAPVHNVRAGLFGTSLTNDVDGGNDMEDDLYEDQGSGMNGFGGGGGGRGRGGGGGRRGKTDVSFKVTLDGLSQLNGGGGGGDGGGSFRNNGNSLGGNSSSFLSRTGGGKTGGGGGGGGGGGFRSGGGGGGRGGGGKGGRGGGASRGKGRDGGGGGGGVGGGVSTMDLDAQLEAHMAKRYGEVMNRRKLMSAPTAAKPSRRKSCEHPSCPKQPAFSFNGSGVRFCAKHRLSGMVNVRNRRCEGENCTKEPYFGEKGGKARFCATHKPDTSMVDVRHRRCEFESCHKQPNYGYEGERACYCSTHKLPTMVDVKHRRCAEAGCRGYSSFAFPGSKEKFCAAHRRDGMVPSGRGRAAKAAAAAATTATAAPAAAYTPPATATSPVSADDNKMGDGEDDGASDATAPNGSPVAVTGSGSGSRSPPLPLPPVAPYSFSSTAVAGATAAAAAEGGMRRRKCWSLERGVGVGASIGNGYGNGREDSLAQMAISDGGHRGVPITGGSLRGFAEMQLQQQLQQQQQQQQQQQDGREAGEGGVGNSSAAAFDWRRRSCPPDLGTAAVAYVAQQRQRMQGNGGGAGSSGGGGFGVRPLDFDASAQQLRHQRRRLDSFGGGGEMHHHHDYHRQSLVRSFSPGERQNLPPLPLPLPSSLPVRQATSPRSVPVASPAAPWGSPAPAPAPALGPGPSAAAGGGGGGGGGGGVGERWPRAPIADTGVSGSSASSSSFAFSSAPATASRGDDPPFFSQQQQQQQQNPVQLGRSEEGVVTADGNSSGGSIDTAAISATIESVGMTATTASSSTGSSRGGGREGIATPVDRELDRSGSGGSSTTWADDALKSRLLPKVNNLLPPAAAVAAAAASSATPRITSAATLTPQWRGGLPRSRSLFSFRGRAGDGHDSGLCSSSSPWWTSFRRGAAAAAAAEPVSEPTPPASPTGTGGTAAAMASESWSSKSSSVVTLHGGRNSHTRLARLSAAAATDDGTESLGPTLETLELVA